MIYEAAETTAANFLTLYLVSHTNINCYSYNNVSIYFRNCYLYNNKHCNLHLNMEEQKDVEWQIDDFDDLFQDKVVGRFNK